MRRWNSKRRILTGKITAFLLCVSMLGSVPAGIADVNAAQLSNISNIPYYGTSEATTEAANIDANGTLGKNSDVGVEVTKSITGTAGKAVKVSFKLKSNDTVNIKLKDVYPVIDAAFPFETSGDAYKVVTADGDPGKQAVLEAEYSMTARSDLETGYHSVRFIGEYTKIAADGSAADYYVIKTINIYFAGTGSSTSASSTKDDDEDSYVMSDDEDDDEDSYDPGIYSGGGSDSSAEVTAPKLIITGFETDPERVMAGQSFKIKIHIQNSSKTTSVCNGKFLIGDEAGNFLPTSGSNAVFVESIPTGETGDIEIELKTSAELAQKNYRLMIKGDFDDGKGNTFSASESVYLPVYQEVKLAISDVSMTPESIGIGSEGSLMFTINNQGSAGVYNVNVSVKDDAATGEQGYVGNIAANSSAYATLNIVGAQDNSDRGTIKVLITYEDSEGNAGELEQDVACLIGVDASMDEFESEFEDEYEDESYGLPWWLYVLIALLVIAIIAVVVIIVVKKRKKRMAALLEEDDDLDDDFEDDLSESDSVKVIAGVDDNLETDVDSENSSDEIMDDDTDTISVEGNDNDLYESDSMNREDDRENEDF
ncbi:MAG: hypothetical protein ACI4A3_05885 [Lachnospiraceae bacterium]